MQKLAKSTTPYTILYNRIRRSLLFVNFNWSSIHCVRMCIQAIGADNFQSSEGSCRGTATRNKHIPRLVKQNLNPKPATKIV